MPIIATAAASVVPRFAQPVAARLLNTKAAPDRKFDKTPDTAPTGPEGPRRTF